MLKDFHDHFLSEGRNGLINDVEIIFVDKTEPSDPTRRRKFWRNKLKTLAPYRLNTRSVNYKTALTCKVVILKKAVAETSIQNGVLLCDYPIYRERELLEISR